MQPATFTLRQTLSGRTLKAWRISHRLTASALAIELGVTRSYIKSIEGGSLEASQKFIRRFNALRSRQGEGSAPDTTPKPVTIISRFALPNSFEILCKPRRCKGCRKYFVPVTPNQKMHHTAACQKKARQKARPTNQKRRR